MVKAGTLLQNHPLQWITAGRSCRYFVGEITETDPGLKGDTAQGGSKPATLSTGAVVRVPLFITEGEVIRVDTRTGEYVSRASKN